MCLLLGMLPLSLQVNAKRQMRKVEMRIQSELFDKPQQITLMKTSEQFLKVAVLTGSEDTMS